MSHLKIAKMSYLPLIGGGLYALGFPSILGNSSLIAPLLGFALFLFSLDIGHITNTNKWPRSAILKAYLFSLGHYLIGFPWIPYTLKEFGALPLPFNYLLGLLFSTIIFWHLYLFVLLVYLGEKYLKHYSKTFKEFFYSGIFVFLEINCPQQFPAHLAHPWLKMAPWLGLAPIMGQYIFSFSSMIIAFELKSFLFLRNKLRPFYLIYILLFMSVNFIHFQTKWNDRPKNSINLRIIQPNVGNFVKISAENGIVDALKEVKNNLYQYSVSKSSVFSSEPDLIIWPETAYPHTLSSFEINNELSSVPALIRDISRKLNAHIIFGGYDKINPTDPIFDIANTLYSYRSNEKLSFYHKIKLIPFGETLPFGLMNKYLAPYTPGVNFFARGSKQQILSVALKDTRYFYVPLICYEVLFTDFVYQFFKLRDVQSVDTDQKPKIDFFVNITNDSWYEDPEPRQHQFLAKWRAHEFGIPLIRSTNTGITSVYYPNGESSKELPFGSMALLDHKLQLATDNQITIYGRFGPLIFYAFWLTLLISIIIGGNIIKRIDSKS